jgi:hypothetical protein
MLTVKEAAAQIIAVCTSILAARKLACPEKFSRLRRGDCGRGSRREEARRAD